jgi:hypothetical protein
MEASDPTISAGESTLAGVFQDTYWSIDGAANITAASKKVGNEVKAVEEIDTTTEPNTPRAPTISNSGTKAKKKKATICKKTNAKQNKYKSAKPRVTNVGQSKNTTDATTYCLLTCKHERRYVGSMTRCDLCMTWYHDDCVHISDNDRSGLWMCHSCRQMPSTLDRILSHVEKLTVAVANVNPLMKALTTDLKNLQQTNADLINTLMTKETQLTMMNKENGVLKEQLKATQERLTYAKAVTAHATQKTLVIGTSIVKHLKATKNNVSVESYSGSSITNLTHQLRKRQDNMYTHIILQAGSSDCSTEHSPSDIIREYKALVKEAKRVSQNVTVSSILPRLDNADAHQKARAVNQILQNGARLGDFTLVDNDTNFYLMNNAVDDSLFWRDNLHLNKRGATRLVANFGLTDSVQVYIETGNTSDYRPRSQLGDKTQPQSMNRSRSHDENHQGDGNGNKSRPSGGCVFCGERNHTWNICRHGTYIKCDRCNRPGHKAKRCTY